MFLSEKVLIFDIKQQKLSNLITNNKINLDDKTVLAE